MVNPNSIPNPNLLSIYLRSGTLQQWQNWSHTMAADIAWIGFLYRALACNVCRERYSFTSSVCLSVCLSNTMYCVKMNGNIVIFFGLSSMGIILGFLRPTAVTKFQGKPLRRGDKYKRVGKLCRSNHLSQKRYEIRL